MVLEYSRPNFFTLEELMDSKNNLEDNNEAPVDNKKALIRMALLVIVPVLVMFLIKYLIGGK